VIVLSGAFPRIQQYSGKSHNSALGQVRVGGKVFIDRTQNLLENFFWLRWISSFLLIIIQTLTFSQHVESAIMTEEGEKDETGF